MPSKKFEDIKIAFAGRDLIDQFSGSSEYLRGLISAFSKIHNPQNIYVYYNHPSLIGTFPSINEKIIEVKNRIAWDHLYFPRELKKDNIDLAIFPKGTRSLWLPCRSAVIMLDLGYFYKDLKAYKFLDTIYMKQMIRFSANYGWRLLAISDHTKADITKYLKVDSKKIGTIWGGVNKKYQPIINNNLLEQVKNKYSLHTPFIFYPTSLSPRKNFNNLLKAFDLAKENIPHHIYFTGGFSWGMAKTEKLIANQYSDRIHKLGKVAPEDMASLFSLADFIIYPSLLEGFGLPIIEAFQSGTPIITSNRSSMAEIAGNAAHLVDPEDPLDLAIGLQKLADDSSYKDTLRQKGLVQAKKFTWEKTASLAHNWLANEWENQ